MLAELDATFILEDDDDDASELDFSALVAEPDVRDASDISEIDFLDGRRGDDQVLASDCEVDFRDDRSGDDQGLASDGEVDFLANLGDGLEPEPIDDGRARKVRKIKGLRGPANRTQVEHNMMVRIMNDARLTKLTKAAGTPSNLTESLQAEAEQDFIKIDGRLRRTAKADLLIAFDNQICVSSIARSARCSNKYVRETIMAVAYALDCIISRTFSSILMLLDCANVVLSWDVVKLDEASQRLSLKTHALLSRDQGTSAFNILVTLLRVGWIERLEGTRMVRREYRIPCKPVILIGSKGAGVLWTAVFKQKWSEAAWAFIKALHAKVYT